MRSAFARWQRHINAVQVSPGMVDWLTNRSSLTARLIEHSSQFRVQRLYQGRAMCLHDEYAEIGLVKRQQVVEREVLLRCDDEPVVYAHTILPLLSNAHDWPAFASLGNRSLGTTLFNDPLVQRGELHYARLGASHPLVKRIARLQLLPARSESLLARRSVFIRRGARLLVTEVFLPSIEHLRRQSV